MFQGIGIPLEIQLLGKQGREADGLGRIQALFILASQQQ